MTTMLNTVTTSAPAQAAQASQAAGNVATSTNSAAPAGQAVPAASSAAQPFAQWMGRQAAGAALPATDALPALPGQDAAADASATSASAADAAPGDAADGSNTAVQPDGALLAAMAMPLMPLSPAQVAQALQAAQGNGPQSGSAKGDGAGASPSAAVKDDARRIAVTQGALPALAPMQQPAPVAQAAQPVQQPAQHDADTAAVRVAVQAAGADSGSKDGGFDAAAPGASNAPGAAIQAGAALAAAPASPQPGADTVKLAGPPTAWRQSLQEALGERLQLQVGNKVEQAVIRLEPPQLGQIDIAIRHSAGSLEVNISATHSEVLRQLQTVSDNLRNDLSQRQFSDVAVTVTATPKNNAAPFGDPQQQGRGRQQGREQDDYEPGRALAEAGNPASAFSLGGRDRA